MTNTLRIAIAQTDQAPESHEAALSLLRRAMDTAPDANLLVLPELALCGYGDGERIRRLAAPIGSAFIADVQALARDAGIGLIFGYAELEDQTRYNSALAIGPDGGILGNYRKVNLWGTHERGLFRAGEPSPVLRFGAMSLGLLICYDLEFPEAARDLVLRGADTLVVISATSRPYEVVPNALVPARGYETGSYVIYANRAGVDGAFTFIGSSRVTAPDGSVLAAAPVDRAAIIRAEISPEVVERWRSGHDYLRDRRPDLYTLA